MSDNERPEVAMLLELQQLVHHLADELAAFRQRAIKAEGELKAVHAEQLRSDAGGRRGMSVADLETENAELRRRMDAAGKRAKAMLERVRFLRQQHVQQPHVQQHVQEKHQ